MKAREANFDGLVGLTHSYAGLARGNIASEANRQAASNPRLAALQGLEKMKALADRGFLQGVLPPQERPDMRALRRLGFRGDDASVLAQAARDAPHVLAACSSAASMWVANAATVSPSADTADGRVHFTPANLVTHFHRSLEAPTTARVLQAIFADANRFAHHPPLPAAPQFGDEGAANHTRLCGDYGSPGIELFVFGRSGFDTAQTAPQRFPARQTREASEAIARLHGLAPERTVFAPQNPDAIDAGVFHNDVIAVGNRNLLFFHERAFREQDALMDRLRAMLGGELHTVMVPEAAVSVADAVASYLFNSQLLSCDDGTMLLVAPEECRQRETVWRYLEALVASGGPIREVLTFDLRQSMRNGGGPACLRLRIVLTEAEQAAVSARAWLDEGLYGALRSWVERHYRDRLLPADLADPALLEEGRRALDEVTQTLGLGTIYPFQQ
jgi:succinylarginine dihydrolase